MGGLDSTCLWVRDHRDTSAVFHIACTHELMNQSSRWTSRDLNMGVLRIQSRCCIHDKLGPLNIVIKHFNVIFLQIDPNFTLKIIFHSYILRCF